MADPLSVTRGLPRYTAQDSNFVSDRFERFPVKPGMTGSNAGNDGDPDRYEGVCLIRRWISRFLDSALQAPLEMTLYRLPRYCPFVTRNVADPLSGTWGLPRCTA